MAGHQKINIYGWKQLARWSIEHACLSTDERRRILTEWEKRWQDFIDTLGRTATFTYDEWSVADIAELRSTRKGTQARRLANLRNAKDGTSAARL